MGLIGQKNLALDICAELQEIGACFAPVVQWGATWLELRDESTCAQCTQALLCPAVQQGTVNFGGVLQICASLRYP